MGAWDAWIGREEHRHDTVDGPALGRWLATLDRNAPADGTAPHGFHWCVCLPDAPTAKLGSDGHPVRIDSPASFLPPVPLPRRMWAASKLAFHAPLRTGDQIRRMSRVLSVKEKSGSTGPLVFVEVLHETHVDAGLAVAEWQSIVYRDAPAADAALIPPLVGDGRLDLSDWRLHRVVEPDAPLLFRFSALTFNSHRIHYDFPYAQHVERYRGLVVHGPLIATLLLDLVRREIGDGELATFAFRGMSPAICNEALHLVMRGSGPEFELGVFASDGRQIVSGQATAKRMM